MTKPTIAIVGRPNVGKSTLFNRIAGARISIVEDKPGITRDRIYTTGDWMGRSFSLIDTGGLEVSHSDPLHSNVRVQVMLAIDEADVILFLTDATTGVTEADKDIAALLYRARKPVVLAVNKVDHPKRFQDVYEFYELGFGEPVAISAEHGIGTGDLLARILQEIPAAEEEPDDHDVIRVAVIGRPNVGKSSLVNAILGEERVIVSSEAGTTRDAVDTPFEADGQAYVLIDTAGMRKRGKIYEKTEKYSVLRALKAIERADVALVILDAEQGIVEQDKKIAGYAHEAGRASVFIVNKWDLLEKETETLQKFTKEIQHHFHFMDYAPVLFVSAKTGQRIQKILPVVDSVAEYHSMRVPTSVVNNIITDAMVTNPPPSKKGKKLRILYATQVAVKPPTFVLFVNDAELMHFSYLRYIENKLREAFQFTGTPVRLIVRNKNRDT